MAARPLTTDLTVRDRILRGAESLGILGGSGRTGAQLMSLLCRATVTAAEVAREVSHEPALYARVLRVANSPFYGCRREIRTLTQAIVLLGLDAVRGIAAAACLDRALSREREGGPIELRSLVVHSLATAVAAETLARSRYPALASDAFIAGLLHNLGIAVQLHVDAEGVRELVERRLDSPASSLREAESLCIDVGHEECVATVFEAWGFPAALVAAARNHHAPGDAEPEHRTLAALVTLGASLGVRSGHAFALEPSDGDADGEALRIVGVGQAELDEIASALPERVESLRSALLD
jgi:HD-like signal output (HDOD) protein